MSTETTIAVVACTLVGAGLLMIGLYQRNRMRIAQSWPQVWGTTTTASVVTERGSDEGGHAVSLTYDYVANGVRYTGTRIGFSRRKYVRKKRAEAELEKYPVNSNVAVYFDPQKPADAVLVREYPDSIMLVVYGIAMLALAAGIIVAERA